MIGSTSGSRLVSASSLHSAFWSGSLQHCQCRPLNCNFIFGNRKNHRGLCPVNREGGGDDCCIRRNQKLLRNKRRVSQNIVMIQGPRVVAPIVWALALDVFPHSPQNVTMEFSCLSWWNKFLMHNTFSVKLLPRFRSWFKSKVVKNALHRLTCIHS